ncbi:MAG: hypothetical protein RSA10_03990 [Bacilli bacterium]
MLNSICIQIFSLCYILLLAFCKTEDNEKTEKNLHLKIFDGLIIANFLGLILHLFCYFTVSNTNLIPIINIIVSKLYLVSLLSWISLFTIYIFIISNPNIEKNVMEKKRNFKIKFLTIPCLIYLIVNILIFILPLSYVNESGMIYSYGPSANIVYYVSEILVIVCLIFMFFSPKNIKGTKYAPLFIFIAGGAIIMILQSMHPELLLMTSMETFVTFLMYFTIEKSDTKIIDSNKKTNKEIL